MARKAEKQSRKQICNKNTNEFKYNNARGKIFGNESSNLPMLCCTYYTPAYAGALNGAVLVLKWQSPTTTLDHFRTKKINKKKKSKL